MRRWGYGTATGGGPRLEQPGPKPAVPGSRKPAGSLTLGQAQGMGNLWWGQRAGGKGIGNGTAYGSRSLLFETLDCDCRREKAFKV